MSDFRERSTGDPVMEDATLADLLAVYGEDGVQAMYKAGTLTPAQAEAYVGSAKGAPKL